MRFRRLTDEELKAVEVEFTKFLASNGLDAPEWQRIKSDNPARVEGLLDDFSTFFWESTTSRIKYLEKITETEKWVFKFEESSAEVMRWMSTNGGDPELMKGKKEFPEEARGREVFLLLEQGLVPCPEERHEELEKLFKAQSLIQLFKPRCAAALFSGFSHCASSVLLICERSQSNKVQTIVTLEVVSRIVSFRL